MSVADTIFINMCRDVIENGTSTEVSKVGDSVLRQNLWIRLMNQVIRDGRLLSFTMAKIWKELGL